MSRNRRVNVVANSKMHNGEKPLEEINAKKQTFNMSFLQNFKNEIVTDIEATADRLPSSHLPPSTQQPSSTTV